MKDLRQQIVENELRIEELTALKTQLTNQSDITMVEETIQALIQENISLESKIAEEMQTKSLFGWLARFLAQ